MRKTMVPDLVVVMDASLAWQADISNYHENQQSKCNLITTHGACCM